MGLPGVGKTTLAARLARSLTRSCSMHDAVRANLSRDLGFGHQDRVEHARRMGWMCDRVVEAGGTALRISFVRRPTRARLAMPSPSGLTASTPAALRTPTGCSFSGSFRLRFQAEGSPQYWAEQAMARLRPAFDPESRRRCLSAAISRFMAAISG